MRLPFKREKSKRKRMKNGIIRDHNQQEITISKIILGTALFGADISREQAFRFMDAYYDHGGRVLDTARVYSDWLPGGHSASERTVGEWIRERGLRSEVILMTKGAHPPMEEMHRSRVNAKEIRADLEESLQVLQTDYVDVYFLHRDDESVPVSVIMDVLHEFIKEGKVRMLGASNWKMARILEANAYARTHGKTPFSVSEIQWSYALCTPKETLGDETQVCMNEQEMDLYRQAQLPVMAFSSQAQGVFSKGYKEDLSDLSKKHRAFYSEENVRRYQALLQKCRETGCTPSRAALDYIIENQEIEGFAIVGCSRMEQLLESLEAAQG